MSPKETAEALARLNREIAFAEALAEYSASYQKLSKMEAFMTEIINTGEVAPGRPWPRAEAELAKVARLKASLRAEFIETWLSD